MYLAHTFELVCDLQGLEPNFNVINGTKIRNGSTCASCTGNTATHQVFGQVTCFSSRMRPLRTAQGNVASHSARIPSILTQLLLFAFFVHSVR